MCQISSSPLSGSIEVVGSSLPVGSSDVVGALLVVLLGLGLAPAPQAP